MQVLCSVTCLALQVFLLLLLLLQTMMFCYALSCHSDRPVPFVMKLFRVPTGRCCAGDVGMLSIGNATVCPWYGEMCHRYCTPDPHDMGFGIHCNSRVGACMIQYLMR